MGNDELMEKMTRVARNLSEKKGVLKFFALNWREEYNQWDILVSADWVDYDKLRDNISDIFQEVKKEFNGQYSLLFTGIHPLRPEEAVVQSITKAVAIPSGSTELVKCQFGNLYIERMILFVSR